MSRTRTRAHHPRIIGLPPDQQLIGRIRIDGREFTIDRRLLAQMLRTSQQVSLASVRSGQFDEQAVFAELNRRFPLVEIPGEDRLVLA